MNSRQSKILNFINYRVRVIIQDSRMLVGTLLAFDKHMNLVLADTEEFTRIKPKIPGELPKELKRALGLIILRGENIISFSAESPPSQAPQDLIAETIKEGEGKSAPISRVNVHEQPTLGLTGINKVNPINKVVQIGNSFVQGTNNNFQNSAGRGTANPSVGIRLPYQP